MKYDIEIDVNWDHDRATAVVTLPGGHRFLSTDKNKTGHVMKLTLEQLIELPVNETYKGKVTLGTWTGSVYVSEGKL